jgi:hypothetical protein
MCSRSPSEIAALPLAIVIEIATPVVPPAYVTDVWPLFRDEIHENTSAARGSTHPDERIPRIRFFTRKLRSRYGILVDNLGCRQRVSREHSPEAWPRQIAVAAAPCEPFPPYPRDLVVVPPDPSAVSGDANEALPFRFELVFTHAGPRRDCKLVWQRGKLAGVKFVR